MFQIPNWSFVVFAFILLAGITSGQEENSEAAPESANSTSAESPAAGAPTSNAQDDEDDKSIRERTIYIPFEKLRDVFEKDNRKVVLSYKEFNELWKAARNNSLPRPAVETKQGSLISQADSSAEIMDSVVTVSSKLKIELLSKGWSRVPLGLKNAAIQSAKVGEQDAKIVFDPNVGYLLLAKNNSDDPLTLELDLKYARAFQKSPGQSAVSFLAPQAPVNRWKIRIPQPQVKINVTPLLAVTEPETKEDADDATTDDESDDGPQKTYDPKTETVILAYLGVAPQVTLSWNPKSEGAAGLDAIVSAQTTQQIVIDKNVQRSQVTIQYEISRATLSSLTIEVPKTQKVTNVFNENVKKWNVEEKGEKQLVNVELFSPIKGNQSLTMELERLTEEALKQDFNSPMVSAVDAARQQGVVVVKLAEGLRSVTANRLGLLQLDKTELPAPLSRNQWDLAFRYASLPYQLDLSVEKILPQIVSEQLVETDISPNKIKVDVQVQLDIQQAGIFKTQVKIPVGYTVLGISGYSAGNKVQPISVSEYRVDENDKSLWTIDFARKAMGKIGMLISLERETNDPNLLTPTGNSSTLDLPFPELVDGNIEYSTGSAIVYGPVSLRVNPKTVTALQQVTPTKATEKLRPRGSRLGGRSILAYHFSGQPSLSVDVLRRKPQVTTRQLLTAKIESGVVKYDAFFYYDVLYSGVKQFQLDLPQSVASSARNLTPGITESEAENADDVPEGYVRWNLKGESEFFGNQQVHLNWEEKIDDLEIGTSVDVEIPRLIPVGVDRADGQIVTSKSETIDLQPVEGLDGLVPLDPKVDLMPEASITDAATAFEFVDQWNLSIRATRYDVEDVKLTNIEAGLVQMVQLRQSGLNVRAFFRIRSAVQRLGIKLPEGVDPKTAFDSQPVRINGAPVNLELGNDDQLFIPLTEIETDEPFLLDLRYKVSGDAARLVLPTFADDPAMQKVYLCVYVPQEKAVVGSVGPWTNELLKDKTPGDILFEGSLNEYYTEQQIRDRVDSIQNDIRNGVNSFTNAPDFKTDGRSFLFSSLRPDPTQELKVVALSKWTINALLIAIVSVLGLPLYRRPITWQLGALFLILAAVVMSGVFFPMLARQILNPVLFISIGLVIGIWVIGHVATLSFGLKNAWDAATSPEPVSFEEAPPEEPDRPSEPAESTARSQEESEENNE